MASDDEDRWVPDEQLLPALLAGSTSVRYANLDRGDRAWAIAGLRLAGVTVEAIADQIECSVRQVHDVASQPAAILATFYMTEAEAFGDTLRMIQDVLAQTARDLADAERDRDRYRASLGRMIDAAMVGELGPTFPKCGHPKTKYNCYTAPKTGKVNCRMCHAEAQADYRARLKAAETTAEKLLTTVGRVTSFAWQRAIAPVEPGPASPVGARPSPDEAEVARG